ncbi:MAG: dihydrodipicolinate synthase family protein, partial [Chitinophagaceae bacterium]|nr:dihydrodipicolinate synthase family protein [Rubrivivax sp.]
MTVLTGVLPILPTIFAADGALDEAGTQRVLEDVMASGAHGVVFPGLASEYEHLASAERLLMTARLGEWIGGRMPFVIGASSASGDDAVRYAEAAARAGAAAV